MFKQKIIIAVLSCLSLFSCGNNESSSSTTTKVKDKPIPTFNADSAYQYVQAQVDFGPRVPNTMAHDMCGSYLASELIRHGATVIEQPVMVPAYDGTTLNGKNIIGSFFPRITSYNVCYTKLLRVFKEK